MSMKGLVNGMKKINYQKNRGELVILNPVSRPLRCIPNNQLKLNENRYKINLKGYKML